MPGPLLAAVAGSKLQGKFYRYNCYSIAAGALRCAKNAARKEASRCSKKDLKCKKTLRRETGMGRPNAAPPGSSIKRKFKGVKEASAARGRSDGATRWARNPSGGLDSLGGQPPYHLSPRPSAAGTHTRSKNMADVSVPLLLQQGTPMKKVSARKQKQYVFRLDPDQGQIIWEQEKLRTSAFYYLFSSACR